jgi:hypothetical protein
MSHEVEIKKGCMEMRYIRLEVLTNVGRGSEVLCSGDIEDCASHRMKRIAGSCKNAAMRLL